MFLWVGISLVKTRIGRSHKGTRNDLRHYGCVERVLGIPNGDDAWLGKDMGLHKGAWFNCWDGLHTDGGVAVVRGTFIRLGPFSFQTAYLVLDLSNEFLR